MRRTSIAISSAALFFSLGGVGAAANIVSTGTIHAATLTSRFHFRALPRRVETECEPTTAKAVLLAGRRTPLPVLLENQAHNGSVYLFEHGHDTCASIVNWTNHRARVHFALTLLDTTTRL